MGVKEPSAPWVSQLRVTQGRAGMESNTGKCSNISIMEHWDNGATKHLNDNTPGCSNNKGTCSSDKMAELLDDKTVMKGSSDKMVVEGLNNEAEKYPSDEAAGGSSCQGAVFMATKFEVFLTLCQENFVF